jgi:hypothetical protein
VIDLEDPPRDRQGRGRRRPEGLAMLTADGGRAAARQQLVKSAYFYSRNGSVVALKIDGKKSPAPAGRGARPARRRVQRRQPLSVHRQLHRPGHQHLRVEGDQLVDTGKSVQLPGQPAMRGKMTH